jgi:hypothetical protein
MCAAICSCVPSHATIKPAARGTLESHHNPVPASESLAHAREVPDEAIVAQVKVIRSWEEIVFDFSADVAELEIQAPPEYVGRRVEVLAAGITSPWLVIGAIYRVKIAPRLFEYRRPDGSYRAPFPTICVFRGAEDQQDCDRTLRQAKQERAN